MNKAELLTDLEGRVLRLIGTPSLKTDIDGVKVYIQTVLAAEGADKANERNIAFIVVDEGTGTEAAYYRDTQHRQKDDESKARTYLGNMVSNGTIAGYDIEQVRADLGPYNFFTVKAFADNGSGKLVEKRFLVSKDAQGVVQRKEII